MGDICVERVKIHMDLSITALQSMKIHCEANEHAAVQLELLIKNQENCMEIMEGLIGRDLRIDEILDEKNKHYRRLFSGFIKNVVLINTGTFITIAVSGVSYSEKMDRERKSGSFQNISQTYNSIVQDVISRKGNASVEWDIPEDPAIGRFIIQYEETDWEFMKRLSSHMHALMIVDEKSNIPMIHIGTKRRQKWEWDTDDLCVYEKGIDKQYEYILNNHNDHGDFLYYSFKSKKNYDICDWFMIEEEIFLVKRKEAIFDKGELYFLYRIEKECTFWQPEKYNSRLKGISLCGTIKNTEKEKVYMQLDIDKEDNADYAFLWEPVYGDLVYCMPECGEQARLHFVSEDEREACVIHTVRGNGGNYQKPEGDCEGLKKEQNRIFTTNKRKQLRLYPEELSLESGCLENLLELKDNKGISFNTPQAIKIAAEGNIEFYSEKMLVSALQEIRLKGMVSSIQINRNFNIFSPNKIENCGMDNGKGKTDIVGSYTENRKWENNYNALASIPVMNFDSMEYDSKTMCAMASMPVVSDGMATVAMSELLDGKEIEDTSFPSAFSSMENKTMNGGYLPPDLDE